MQRRKIRKISIFNSLDVIFDFLTSRVENLNRVSTRNRYQIESECWNRVFESSQKIDIEYSSRIRRLISKLNLTISLEKKKSVESYLSYIWVISESNLTSSLISSNHYAENSLAFTANWLKLQPCSVLIRS